MGRRVEKVRGRLIGTFFGRNRANEEKTRRKGGVRNGKRKEEDVQRGNWEEVEKRGGGDGKKREAERERDAERQDSPRGALSFLPNT